MLQHTEGDGYIYAAKIAVISQAVLAACDSQDGLKDGILNDPRQCQFDPTTLLCKGKSSDACLTQPQVDSLKQIYAGGHEASGKPIFPGLLPGAEEGHGGWEAWITGDAPGRSLADFYVLGFFTNMVYRDKNWDFRKANIDASLKLATERAANTMNANNADLKAFHAHGGKLILYHGWNDPAISSLNTIDYYNRVIAALGNDSVQQFVRLYMVPGMQHCMGGPGATVFGQSGYLQRAEGDTGPDRDIFTALVQWVESGQAPGRLIATRYRDDDPTRGVQITRPLCIYPQSAKYNGSGDPDRASSFTCSLGK
jgi:feruloyl esterase